jgi:hypothetical protein
MPVERTIRIPRLAQWALNELFTVSLVTYLAFYLFDSLVGSFISKQFNMNILLWIVVASGVLSVWCNPSGRGMEDAAPTKNRITWVTVVYIVGLGVVAGLIIYIKTRSLGRMGLLVSGVSALLVIALSLTLLFEEKTDFTHHDSRE